MKKLAFAIPLLALPLVTSGVAGAESLSRGKWGIGLRTTAQKIKPENYQGEQGENGLKLGGAGITFRYRIAKKWTLELTSEKVDSEQLEATRYQRTSKPVTFTALWHMTPQRRWDWYLLLGVGGTEDEVTYRKVDGTTATEKFSEAHVHFGVGVERMWGKFGVGAELRAIGLARNDEEGDGVRYQGIDGPIPAESSGTQFNLTATYYF